MLMLVMPGTNEDPYRHPYERPELPAGAQWGHALAHHHGAYVYPGRAVLLLPAHERPDTPARCTNRERFAHDWYGQGADYESTVLVCRRCGLDVT